MKLLVKSWLQHLSASAHVVLPQHLLPECAHWPAAQQVPDSGQTVLTGLRVKRPKQHVLSGAALCPSGQQVQPGSAQVVMW